MSRSTPSVSSPAFWARFLVGFALLWEAALGGSAADTTGRYRVLHTAIDSFKLFVIPATTTFAPGRRRSGC
jgi:hypothetical protein